MSVTVLIPAHNEAAQLAATLYSLGRQTREASRVVVVADNCTDDTAAIGFACGAEVIRTVGNKHKKAGALNFAFGRLDLEGLVLVMDADTQLSDDFIERAARRLAVDPALGAVGAVFRGQEASGWIEWCQSNEYTRYARSIDRTGRVMVLSGTASLIRASALRDIGAARGTGLPGHQGDFYSRDALTEDNELTLALKTLGWRLESPVPCRTTTELMPTVSSLFRQRLRWYRGALESLPRYGFTRVTARYWFQQAMLTLTTIMMFLYLGATALVVAAGQFQWSSFWLAVGLIFVVERLVTVWSNGPGGRAWAALVLPEMIYDLILMTAFVTAAANTLFKTTPKWHHLEGVSHV